MKNKKRFKITLKNIDGFDLIDKIEAEGINGAEFLGYIYTLETVLKSYKIKAISKMGIKIDTGIDIEKC